MKKNITEMTFEYEKF